MTCPADPLGPGEILTCTPVDYVIAAADEAAGVVVNRASAEGTPPPGATPPEPTSDTTSTPVSLALPFTGSNADLQLAIAHSLLLLAMVFVLLAQRRSTRRRAD